MLDSTSLEVISQFKQALHKSTNPIENEDLPSYNRGLKLNTATQISPNFNKLTSKVVEYGNKEYVVLTNEVIENETRRRKRKWNDEEVGSEEESESESESEEEALIDQNKIIELLSPLNHPSEIISHPAISKTYRSETLSKLSMESISLIEIEQNNLNWLNKLLHVLNGEDWFYLLEENLGLQEYDDLDDKKDGKKDGKKDDKEKNEIKNGITKDRNEEKEEKEENDDKEEGKQAETSDNSKVDKIDKKIKAPAKPESETVSTDPFFALPSALERYENYQNNLLMNKDSKLNGMKEDLINYLQVSIQRQHEYIKNLTNLRNGLIRADRLKNDLYKWGKEMYDKKSN
ncbi:unnamed protein product [Candida verbasci]|uniref:Transcriptional regulatory protein RXT2 N-terminal domain-containing protein n=1 Tax=Candida verbasci TaxID=1227364 RepID=A0A9W4U0A3_9ASCO|nr:unnamed protein product [Candida verbasci]